MPRVRIINNQHQNSSGSGGKGGGGGGDILRLQYKPFGDIAKILGIKRKYMHTPCDHSDNGAGGHCFSVRSVRHLETLFVPIDGF